jgi:rhamnogalacturonan endolyase
MCDAMEGQTMVLLVLAFAVIAVTAIFCSGGAGRGEKLGRGLVAVRRPDGHVYLGWRFLADDAPKMGFFVFRRPHGGTEEDWRQLNAAPILDSTNYLDERANPGCAYDYRLQPCLGEVEGPIEGEVTVSAEGSRPYLCVPLAGGYQPFHVVPGDLDGDGEYELVVKQPLFNSDPYQHPGYWKRSPGTYKLEAYRLDGTLLWQYDMGWAIEQGIWYSPYTVFDLDGDGRAEVFTKAGEGDPREPTGHVTSGPEWLVVLDGETGEEKQRLPWPSRDGFEDYNRYCRNYLYVAYLDGKEPHLVVQRGTYGLIKIEAYDGGLEKVWSWEASGEYQGYRGQAAHTAVAADVDGDGKDEIVYGSAALDHDGTGLWCRGEGHPDTLHVAHILPDREGLQIFYGIEPPHERYAVCLVDAATGEMIWGYDGPTTHVHGHGMAADVIPDEPGMELWTGEADGSRYFFYTADGRPIQGDFTQWPLAPFAAYWDIGLTKAVVDPESGRVFAYGQEDYLRFFEGDARPHILGVVDMLGDWREEILVGLPGEVRIYTTTIPTGYRRITLMHDRMYRTGAARMGSGYPCQPQESGLIMEVGKKLTGEDFWEGIL